MKKNELQVKFTKMSSEAIVAKLIKGGMRYREAFVLATVFEKRSGTEYMHKALEKGLIKLQRNVARDKHLAA